MSLVGRVLPLQVRDSGAPILLEQLVLLSMEHRDGDKTLVIDASPVDASVTPVDE
jgi:hypothetical protein